MNLLVSHRNKLGDTTNNKEKIGKTNKKHSQNGIAVWGHLTEQQSTLSALQVSLYYRSVTVTDFLKCDSSK